MYLNHHKASRERKRDRMKLVLSKTTELSGSICSLLDKNEFDKHAKDFINHDKVIAIYEGNTKVLIIYTGG